MVIDFRVRPPLKSFKDHIIYASHTEEAVKADQRNFAVLRRNRGESRSAREHSVELFTQEMDAAGITHGVIMGRDAGPAYGTSSNEEIAEFCANSKGRYIGMAGVNGTNLRDAKQTIRDARKMGFVGVAFDNGWVGLHQDHPNLMGLYEAAAADNLILALTASQLMGPDSSYSHPDRLKPIAKAFPNTPLVVTHAAWPWTAHVCSLAYECPNVYMLPDCYLNTGAPGTDEYVLSANRFMSDRLLYGSAYPVRPLGTSLEYFRKLPLTTEAMEGALWKNAQRLLGWPKA
jgi:predicted TIM-barrel fold metal-dependent hydrolase